MSGPELRRQAGRLMVVGVEGLELTRVERAWLKLIRPGGVILFRRNIETASQTFQLLAEISKIIGCDVFRCVDVEGGLVDRLRDSVAPMPSAAAVAATGKPALYRKHGVLIAREVLLLGFNTTLAPVLDLALPASRAVMRTRTASVDPQRVTQYASGFLDGLASVGVAGCGKHFPGLGGGDLDSHDSTPVIERTFDEMWGSDLLPYRSLASKLPMVMVSHAAYPLARSGSGPASLSPEWISDVLQQKIKFRGLVVSDDLEMGGVLSHGSIERAVVGAIAAGTHLVEICKEPDMIIRGYEALLAEAERSVAFRKLVASSARKVSASQINLMRGESIKRPPAMARIDRLRSQISAFARQVAAISAGEVQV